MIVISDGGNIFFFIFFIGLCSSKACPPMLGPQMLISDLLIKLKFGALCYLTEL